MSNDKPTFDRRQAFRLGGMVGVGGLLAACSSSTAGRATSTSTASSSSPVSLSSSVSSSSAASSATASSTASSSASSSATVTPSSITASSPAAAAFSLDAGTRAKLDKIFDTQFQGLGLAGMAAKVWVGDTEWVRTAGSADLAKKTPFRPTDYVRIASISKSFTASAVLRLVDGGALKLSDTLERYIPGIANGTKITLQQMLGMKSGIFDFTADEAAVARFVADPTLAWSDADTLKVIKAHKPAFAPGAQLQYCDSNYALLGMILAKVGGSTVDKMITSQVISRLSLPATSYPTSSTLPSPHPVGYVPGGTITDNNAPFDNAKNAPTMATELNPAFPGAAGAIISSLDDLRAWGHEIAGGTLLKPATQALRLKATRFPGVPINIGYGLGCEVLNDFIGHNGAILGFSSVVTRDPKADVTLAAVANESTNSTTPTATWSYAVIKELFPAQWH